MVKKDEVEIAGPAVVANPNLNLPDYIPGSDWATEVAQAASVNGHDLAKDSLLDALQGVPFMLTRLAFREGIKNPAIDWRPAVCACEGVIANEATLKRRRVNMADLPFDPDAQIVFNDGSTGIYRQVVAYLEAAGYVELPTGEESGSRGESKFDLPPSEWTAVHAGEIRVNPKNDFVEYVVNVRLTAPRGLRISTYESDYNPSGSHTRYLG